MKEAIIKSIAAVVCVVIVCVTMASTVGTYNEAALKAAEISAAGAASSVGGSVDNSGSDVVTPDAGTDTPATPDAGTDAPAADNKAPAALTKADVIKLFNAETAKAAKGSYKLTRTGKFVKNIDVGAITGALNSIIKGVD